MTRVPKVERESSHFVAPGTVHAHIMPISDQCDTCSIVRIRICLYVLGVIPPETTDLIQGEAGIYLIFKPWIPAKDMRE